MLKLKLNRIAEISQLFSSLTQEQFRNIFSRLLILNTIHNSAQMLVTKSPLKLKLGNSKNKTIKSIMVSCHSFLFIFAFFSSFYLSLY